MSNSAPLLEVRNIAKRFPGVQALRGVSLTLNKGEVLAVIGENGTGKSSLMKILAGVQQPDEGQVLLDGQPITIDSCRAAQQRGISLIHQELNLADNLDIAANIFLGREPRRFGFVDNKAIRAGAQKFISDVGLAFSPDRLVSTLAIGHQQMVEIAKALSLNARILIMDEPTSSLSAGESEALFRIVKELRLRGVSIIYISHRLGEVKELADRVVVLRDGQNAGDLENNQITHDAMVRLMVGRELSQFYPHTPHAAGNAALTVENLRTPTWPQHALNFSVRAGEIVGMAGLVGAGRTEVLRSIFGIDQALSGTVSVGGKTVDLPGPINAIAAGLALVPEDRKLQGLILEMSVQQNVSLANLHRNRRAAGFLNRGSERRDSREMIAQLRIKTPHEHQIVQFLSGGNQQKVVIAKWLTMKPRVLMLDEPTRGVDIGAKQEIYGLMEQLAKEGVAILFVSSEMEEVLGMSDRVLVMHEGRISGELPRGELSEEAVMQLATGRAQQAVHA